ncbi:hypothetical protein [Mycobacterium sp.]|uniref:hypothetical protein n=1 Tax=Mycobacterium sp. TaxID=1785 RepID=UPI00333EDA6D|nr:hypothetical protein [Mycobacterium sp.]
MKASEFKLLAVVAVSAVVCIGALGAVTSLEEGSPFAVAGSTMTTGATRTATSAPTTLPIPEAVPGITGPAPLPPEEQGLPGN